MKDKHIMIIAGLLIFAFGLGGITTYYEQKDKLFNEGYKNGTIDALIQFNNQIVNGLLTYGEFRTNVFYQNKSYPVRCILYQQD